MASSTGCVPGSTGCAYRQIAQPFDWTFTRTDLDAVLAKITEHEPKLTLAA